LRSLVLEDARRLTWQEVPDPRRRHEREAIVRPLAVAACDLDLPMILGVTPFPFPIHLGHECLAEVVERPGAGPLRRAMLVPLPEDIDPAVIASTADNLADGWRTWRPA
jgi:threonine dehydrogenase-like Zn-dependent dehydrogenase